MKPPALAEQFTGLWSWLAGLLLIWSVLRPYIPLQLLERFAGRFLRRRLAELVYPYLTITIAEYDSERMKRGEVYYQAKAYLSHRCARQARSLRAEHAGDGERFVLSLGDNEEVVDEFHGATVWWHAVPTSRRGYQGQPWYGSGGEAATEDVGRAYRLMFHERHRDLVVDSYLPHVSREGRAILIANRQRKLYTNSGERYLDLLWGHVVLEHPATFETLAMDPGRKREVMDDLDAFRKGKDYYARIGKAWKRGYLLYGPPGTGKSTMIAAMANYLDYDIYDVELTSVSTNTDLRKLFIDTKAKSIIVVEDIDCSLNLTGKRKKTFDQPTDGQPANPNATNLTLSGLLNFVDGLWSACGSERIIVFTTNHVERLDPALIRRGRMDKHIEMSYCCFQSFKFLANNYLSIDTHPLFSDINMLLQEINITPADVTEILTPKHADDDADSCLADLVKVLKAKKQAKSSSCNAHEEEMMVEDE